MLKKIGLSLFTFLTSIVVTFAQKDGYWDKERATKEEITVSARDRILFKTQDFPEGTTEVVYRITLLDKNQQMAGSLVSVLKAIPDPTGISQGSAGAVFILSKISGDDKCKYSIFSNAESANKYKLDGKTSDACFNQETPISKDAKLLSLDKSPCMKSGAGNLWFGFESKNWIMNQKIIIEVVPWVDNKLSRGWTLGNRKKIIEQCKTSTLAQKMSNSDDFCVCILNQIESKYQYKEFLKIMPIERSKAFRDFGNSCFADSNLNKAVYEELRKSAADLAKKGDLGASITKLTTIVNDGKATAMDYNSLGLNFLQTKQYDKAIKFLREGEKLDNAELLIKLNIAHAYLLNDNYSAAKVIYKQYKKQNVTDSLSWAEKVKMDFTAFAKRGIVSSNYSKILKAIQ